jgi:hypothetical protein
MDIFPKNLAAALLKVQSKLRGVQKDAVNPHFKNRYASLESVIDTIRPVLQECGIVFIQAPGIASADGVMHVQTHLVHAETGEAVTSEIGVPLAKRDPQGAGSAITYACRYSLMAMLGLPPVDDDANIASTPTPTKRDNPHVTQPRDVNEFEVRTNATGEQIDYIPVDFHRVQKLKVADARPVAETLLAAMRMCKEPEQLIMWGEVNAEKFAQLPDKWIDMYQGEYQKLLDDLRANRKAA